MVTALWLVSDIVSIYPFEKADKDAVYEILWSPVLILAIWYALRLFFWIWTKCVLFLVKTTGGNAGRLFFKGFYFIVFLMTGSLALVILFFQVNIYDDETYEPILPTVFFFFAVICYQMLCLVKALGKEAIAE